MKHKLEEGIKEILENDSYIVKVKNKDKKIHHKNIKRLPSIGTKIKGGDVEIEPLDGKL